MDQACISVVVITYLFETWVEELEPEVVSSIYSREQNYKYCFSLLMIFL